MRQPLQHHFAPRWVILIYFVSVIEAVGLSVYFKASLIDPEMASMQPAPMVTQQESGKLATQASCSQCLARRRGSR